MCFPMDMEYHSFIFALLCNVSSWESMKLLYRAAQCPCSEALLDPKGDDLLFILMIRANTTITVAFCANSGKCLKCLKNSIFSGNVII